MKQKTRMLTGFILLFLFFTVADTSAQYRRYPGGYGRPYYGGRMVYRSRPMVSIGIGGAFGGFYPRVWGYGWGPRVGVNVGVVLPPPGTGSVRGLPPGAIKRVYGGVTYYYRNNTYYREREDGGYEMVEAPLGASVERLPMGAKLRKINGAYYYERNGIFYQKDEDAEGNTEYIIVGKNGELDTDGANNRRWQNDDVDDEKQGSSTRRYNNNEDDNVVVRNANEDDERNTPDNTDDYKVGPQLGDRFDQLPKNSRTIAVDGKKQYVSPTGTYYKEVIEDGKTMYEVVRVK